MGLVSNDDGWRMPDWLWERVVPLLPARPPHPLGCPTDPAAPVAATTVTVGRPPIAERGGTIHPLRGFGVQLFTELFGEAKHPEGVTSTELDESREKSRN